MASKLHFDVALRLGDLTHSSLALTAENAPQARSRARQEAARESGGEPADWQVMSCGAVPAPMRRAA